MAEKVDYVEALNSEQLAVVTGGDGACLVLAGAGTGKTRTIAYRVAWLIDQGVAPESILLVTFTNKAAREMTERIHGLIGDRARHVFSGTFHSVANRILRTYATAYGIRPNFSILSSDDAEDLLGLCAQDVRGKKDVKQFPKASVLMSWISFARNSDIPLERIIEESYAGALPFLLDILEIARRYDTRKREQHVMDFDDLLIRTRDLLRTNHDLRLRLSHQFKYVLVDEFQDTNTIQAQLISLLSTQHGNLLVVGDDAQSIYSFRAADIQNILEFPSRHEATKVFKLTHNYRSTPEILALANISIQQNADQFDKALVSMHAAGEKPVIIGLPNPAMEAIYVADLIGQAIARGTHPHEIAILFRAAHHSQSLEFELMKRGYEYEYRGGMRFFERSHIKDLISFARIFTNIQDEMAWIRILKLFPGIGAATAEKLAQACMKFTTVSEVLLQGIVVPGRAQAGWDTCQDVLKVLDDVQEKPAAFIRRIIANKGYQDYISATFDDARERLDDLEEFAFFAEQFTNLQDFLSSVSLTDEGSLTGKAAARETPDSQKIVLSTIHQAKGLEWKRVFIIHACEGSFPHKRSYGDPQGLEEERRLFYVAVTRAQHHLTITYPETIGYEHAEFKTPSLFIEELPKEVYEDRTQSFGDALVQSASRWGGGGYGGNSRGSWGQSKPSQTAWNEEPTIVLDEMGEEKPQPKKQSPVMQFLRDLDDL